MSAHDPRYLELLPAYAVGALDGDDLRELERHLESGCRECDPVLRGWQDDVEALAASLPPVEPSETTRARILGRVEDDAAVAARTDGARQGLASLALAAALGALLIGGWLHLELKREVADLGSRLAASTERLQAFEAEIGTTRAELARLRLVSGIAASPQKRLVALAGLADPGEAFGQALVDPVGRRAVFYAYGLRPTEAGKTYQLWFIAGGTPVSAGTFSVDAQGGAVLLVQEVAPVEEIDAWAVTVEPAGGVPQPTGPMVLKS